MDVSVPPSTQIRKLPRWQRIGGLWLSLTTKSVRLANTWSEREYQRRSELAAWLILILLLCDLCATLTAAYDLPSLIAVAAIALILLLAICLNKLGHPTAVGWILTLGIIFALLYSITPEGDTFPPGTLDKDALPVYDLLVIPLVISMSLLHPRTGIWIAVLNIGLMTVDFVWQPHTPALDAQILSFGGVAIGTAVMLIRPVILQLALLLVGNLWVRGVIRARIETLQAQKDAELKQRLADLKAQQLRAVKIFVDQIQVANRVGQAITLPQDHPFMEVAALLNTQMPWQDDAAKEDEEA